MALVMSSTTEARRTSVMAGSTRDDLSTHVSDGRERTGLAGRYIILLSKVIANRQEISKPPSSEASTSLRALAARDEPGLYTGPEDPLVVCKGSEQQTKPRNAVKKHLLSTNSSVCRAGLKWQAKKRGDNVEE